jgi:hypothetical protein
MEPNKNKYPGFIDGLKASNIALNRTSLDEYSEQILLRIAKLLENKKTTDNLKEQLIRGEQTLHSTLKNSSTDEVINSYIKFGDIFKSIIPELKQLLLVVDFQDIVINYLQIAKYSTDGRIKDLSISIAKDLE